MAGTIYKESYPNGISLSNPNSTIATTAVVSSPSTLPAPAVYGSSSAVWTLYNYGLVSGNPSNLRPAVSFAGGGTVVNGTPTNTTATISGPTVGVAIGPGPAGPDETGTVTNYGSIRGSTFAVSLSWGGSVRNSGSIVSARDAIEMWYGSAASITNSGYIAGARDAINLKAGGEVTNQGSGSISGAIYSSGNLLRVTNQAGGHITSDGDTILSIGGGAVTNYGSIISNGTGNSGDGVSFAAGSAESTFVTNEAGALIASNGVGVDLGENAASITNFGRITSYLGVQAPSFSKSTIVNYGTITGTGGTAISLGGALSPQTVVAESGSVLNGAIAGFVTGDEIDFADRVGNAATLTNGVLNLTENGTTVANVSLSEAGSSEFAVSSDGKGGTAVTIPTAPPSLQSFAVATDDGSSGDTFTIGGIGTTAGDTITIYDEATSIGTATVGSGGTWSLTTAGPLGIGSHTLTAKEADSAGGQSDASVAETLTVNSAAPNGVTFTGTAGISFTGGAGNDVFEFTASDLTGADTVVGGGGTDHLIMATAGTINVGGVSGVEIYDLASGGANSLTLTPGNFTGVTGRIVVNGGSGGNTINAAALAASELVNLIGGAGNDIFEFSAAGLAAGDEVVGGGGDDELLMTTAGTINAGDVRGVGTYDLANGGANTLTLTSAPFTGVTGGRIIVNGGNDGNIFNVTGPGLVSLIGGAGNDTFYFFASSLEVGDEIVGGGGTDHLIMTTAGTINAGGISGVGIYDFANGAPNSLTLTPANFTGVTSGRIVVNGGNDDNTINASALIASDLVNLIGGGNNDIFEFSANGLAAGDKIVGGGGTDRLVMTTAGTINVGDVSGVGIYDLASDGVNTLTLTPGNFTGVTGGRIIVNNCGSVDATALTASDLVNLIGEEGADIFQFTAAGLAAGDKVVGGAGTNILTITTSGVINAGGVNGVEYYELGGTNTLTLTPENFIGVAGGRITVWGGGGTFNAAALTASDVVSLIGDFNNNTFEFSAAGLTAGDEVVGGGGDDELLMTTAGTIDMGVVVGIKTVDLASGGANTLTLTNANFFGVPGSLITVNGGNDGNMINATALTASDLVNLVGGAGDDTFDFSAASLLAGDTVVGGGGTDHLIITTAGTINASGVSGVAIYDLANGGANTLTLSNANFAGVTDSRIVVNGGSGGNTINAAALTGSNEVSLVGGAGNDVFTVAQHASMTGGGDDIFGFTTPGSLAAPDANTITDFNSSTDEVTFSDAGFNLGLAGASSTPTALPSTLFTSNSTGNFTATAQRFAYDTTTGALYYDSQGSTPGSTSLLVATLTGHPALTASDLFFVS